MAVIAKRTNYIDEHVGARVRMRRLLLDMSQTELGTQLGVSFQQVQKYERGINRLGAGRLQRVSQILKVPVAFFFDGLPEPDVNPGKAPPDISQSVINALISSADGLALISAFMAIKDPRIRRAIVHLIELLH